MKLFIRCGVNTAATLIKHKMTLSALSVYKTSSLGGLLKKALCLCCFVLLCWGMAHADTAIYRFESQEQEKLFYELAAELRCPQCQNNNISESNAGLSDDMRAKVYELVTAGQSKKEIVQYMVDRYGNFITYDPPVTSTTLILWVAPVASLLIGIIYIAYRSRRSGVATSSEEETEEKKEAEESKQKGKKVKKQVPEKLQTTSYAFIGGVMLFSVACTGAICYNTTNWQQIEFKKKAIEAVPELTERYKNGQIENMMQFQMLYIGLRSQLQQSPNNPEGWLMLGEFYDDYMRKPEDALHALERAYRYGSDNYRIKSLYAQLLLRNSYQDADRTRAVELLKAVINERPDHLSSIYWLALYAQSERNYAESIVLWERLLTILPPSSSTDINSVREYLEKDRQAYEQQLQAAR